MYITDVKLPNRIKSYKILVPDGRRYILDNGREIIVGKPHCNIIEIEV